MSTYSANTGRRGTVVGPHRESHKLYLPYASPSIKKEELAEPDSSPSPYLATPPKSRFEGLANAYNAVSWIFGFKEKYSLVLLFVFGGALIGFCLARTMMMNPANIRDLTPSGEWFWYKRRLYKVCIMIHVCLSIISGIFAVFQFIPAIRRRAMNLHRLNGYLVLALLLPSTVCGAIIARRAFGGDLNVQTSFYVLAILIIFSASMGITHVKQSRRHRRWMLRTAACIGVPITARLVSFAARHIISDLGNYYALWRCDQLLFVMTDLDTVKQLYPQCAQAGANLSEVFVAVHAAVKGNGLTYSSTVRLTFGLSMWVSLVSHAFGVEIYIRKTEFLNRHRSGFVLERDDDDTQKFTANDR